MGAAQEAALDADVGTEIIIFGHGGGYHRETQDEVNCRQTPDFVGDSNYDSCV